MSVNPPSALTDAAGYAQTSLTAGTSGGPSYVFAGTTTSNVTWTTIHETGLFLTATPGSGGMTDYLLAFKYPKAGVPFILAVDSPLPAPGFVSTTYGEIWTSILTPSSNLILWDGLGAFGPPASSMVTSPDWSATISVNTVPLAGITFVAQIYGLDLSLPFPRSIVITNPLTVTF